MTPSAQDNIFEGLKAYSVNGQKKMISDAVAKKLMDSGLQVEPYTEQNSMESSSDKQEEIRKKTIEATDRIIKNPNPKTETQVAKKAEQDYYSKWKEDWKQSMPTASQPSTGKTLLQPKISVVGKTEDEKVQDFQSVLAQNLDKNFVKRYLYEGKSPVPGVEIEPLKNPDGTVSTHEMLSFDNKVAPTIIERNGKLVRLNPDQAIQHALRTGEFIEFKDEQTAIEFANNGYKKVNPKQFQAKLLETVEGTAPLRPEEIPTDKEKADNRFPELQQAVNWADNRNEYERGKAFNQFLESNGKKLDNVELQKLYELLPKKNMTTSKEDAAKTADTFGEQMLAEYLFDDQVAKMEDTYLEFLSDSRPKYAEYMRNKLRSLRDKQARGETDQKAVQDIMDFRNEAINMFYQASIGKVADIKLNYDVVGYNRTVTKLNAELASLEKAIANSGINFKQPIPEKQKPLAESLIQKQQALIAQLEEAQQRTGVNDAVLNELNSEYERQAGLYVMSQFRTDEFRKTKDESIIDQKRQASKDLANKRLAEMNGAERIAFSFGNSVASMLYDIPKVPKILGDMVGDTDYDAFDKLYDSLNDYSENVIDFGNYIKLGEKDGVAYGKLPTVDRLYDIFGSGMGSVMMFMTGGQLLNTAKIPSALGTTITSFMMTEAQSYDEALQLGMDTDLAAQAASYISVLTAAIESLVPDAKYADLAPFQKSFLKALYTGKASKEAIKEAFEVLPESIAHYLEGTGQELSEEWLQQVFGEDLGRQSINAVTGKTYYKDLYSQEAMTEAALGGAMPGLFLSILRRNRNHKFSPLQASVIAEAAQQTKDEFSRMVQNYAYSDIDEETVSRIGQMYDFINTKHTELLQSDAVYQSVDSAAQGEILGKLLLEEFGDKTAILPEAQPAEEQKENQLETTEEEAQPENAIEYPDHVLQAIELVQAGEEVNPAQKALSMQWLLTQYNALEGNSNQAQIENVIMDMLMDGKQQVSPRSIIESGKAVAILPENIVVAGERVLNNMNLDPVAREKAMDWLSMRKKQLIANIGQDDSPTNVVSQLETINAYEKLLGTMTDETGEVKASTPVDAELNPIENPAILAQEENETIRQEFEKAGYTITSEVAGIVEITDSKGEVIEDKEGLPSSLVTKAEQFETNLQTLQTNQSASTIKTESKPIGEQISKYKREEFPEEQLRTDTPVTQKLINYLSEVLGIPSINIADGKYISWFQEKSREAADMPGGENIGPLNLALNAPRQVFDKITKLAEGLKKADEKNADTDIKEDQRKSTKKFLVSSTKTGDHNIKVLGSELYVTRELMELAYSNDRGNNPKLGGAGQTLDRIIERGGYSTEELINLAGEKIKQLNQEFETTIKSLEEKNKESQSPKEVIRQNDKPVTKELVQNVKKENDIDANMFDAILPILDELVPNKDQPIPFADDTEENKLLNEQLSERQNPEQTAAIESISAKASSDKPAELVEAINAADELLKSSLNIIDVPLEQINIDEERFQGRQKMNQEKIDDIRDNYNPVIMNPVVLWRDPKQNNKLFLLAGHHRRQGFLARGEKSIPAVIANYTEAEAIHFARVISNAAGAAETPIERAITYRKMLDSGESSKKILETIKKYEGKNTNYIYNLIFLNPKGMTFTSLKQTQDSDSDTRSAMEKIANWIGETRSIFPQLTDIHETEMFQFLLNKDQSKKYTNKTEFKQAIGSIVGTIDFDPSKPLNLARIQYKNAAEEAYDSEFAAIKEEISKREAQIENLKNRFDKISIKKGDKMVPNPDYINPNVSNYQDLLDRRDEKIKDIQTEIKFWRQKQLELQSKKSAMLRAGLAQADLFGPELETPVAKQKPADKPTEKQKPEESKKPEEKVEKPKTEKSEFLEGITYADGKNIPLSIARIEGEDNKKHVVFSLGNFYTREKGFLGVQPKNSLFLNQGNDFGRVNLIADEEFINVFQYASKFGSGETSKVPTDYAEHHAKKYGFETPFALHQYVKQAAKNAREADADVVIDFRKSTIKQVEKKPASKPIDAKKQAFQDAWKKFRDTQSGTGAMAINPDKIAAGMQLVKIAIELGLYKIADIVQEVIDQFGQKEAEDNLEALKQAYGAYRDGEATDEIFDQMDESKTIRAFKIETKPNTEKDGKQTESTPSATDVTNQAKSTAAKAKNTRGNEKSAQQVIEEINDAIEKIDEQLTLVGYYTIEGYNPEKDVTKYGNLQPEKKFKKDLVQFSTKLAEILGYEFDTDRKGRVEKASVNIAPAGGDGTIILWAPNSEYGVYISAQVHRNYTGLNYTDDKQPLLDVNDLLLAPQIYWRITSKSAKYTGFGNTWSSRSITAKELAEKIQEDIKFYLEKEKREEIETKNPPVETQTDTEPIPVEQPTRQEQQKQTINSVKATVKQAVLNDPELHNAIKGSLDNNDLQNAKIAATNALNNTFQSQLLVELLQSKITPNEYDQAANAITESDIEEIINQIQSNEQRDNTGVLGIPNDELPTRSQTGAVPNTIEPRPTPAVRPSGGKPISPTSTRNDVENDRQSGSSTGTGLEGVYGERVNYFPSELPVAHSESTFKKAARFNDNLEALETLLIIEREKRFATPAEQEILSKYVGWGGLKEILRDPNSVEWGNESGKQKERIERLFEIARLLDPTNANNVIRSIQRSTESAFFTNSGLVISIYDALKHLGVTGDNLRLLEPSAGIGNFFMVMPKEYRSAQIDAVELDYLTAKILKNLYQRADVENKGFQDVTTHENYYDVVIGNVPFGDSSIRDTEMAAKFPSLKSQPGNYVHNYFIAKSLVSTKPGGIVAVITTAGTLDAKENANFRKEISKVAKLVTAIRLPNTAFKGQSGTEVVSDILIFQKLNNNEQPEANPNWINTREYSYYDDNKEFKSVENEYWLANYANVLGRRVKPRIPRQKKADIAPLNNDETTLEQRIATVIEKLPRGIYQHGRTINEKPAPQTTNLKGIKLTEGYLPGNVIEQAGKAYLITDNYAIEQELEEAAKKVGLTGQAIRDKHGDINYYDAERLKSLGYEVADFLKRELQPIKLAPRTVEAVKAYNNLRIQLQSLIHAETNGMSDTLVQALRDNLNTTYDAFKFEFGTINDNPLLQQILKLDYESAKVQALEKRVPSGNTMVWEKSDIFNRRTIQPKPAQIKADNVDDAILLNLMYNGNLVIESAAASMDLSVEEFLKQAKGKIFFDPDLNTYVDKQTYLSGNVRKKLERAKQESLVENEAALIEVQPQDLTPSEITVNLASPILFAEDIGRFFDFIAGQEVGDNENPNSTVVKLVTGEYVVRNIPYTVASIVPEGATNKAKEIFQEIINGNSFVYRHTTEEGTIVDEELTEKIKVFSDQVKMKFQPWLWSSEARVDKYVPIYNNTVNAYVERSWDEGAKLNLVGFDYSRMIPKPHQLMAVYRMVRQAGGIIDHIVGAGKTMVIVSTAVELKRTGKANKPIILALKAQIPDMIKNFNSLYPGSKVLAPNENDFNAQNRKAMLARIATNDWDAVIITHDQFQRIQQDPEIEMAILEEEMEELRQAIQETGKEDLSYRDLIKQEDKLKEKYKELLSLQKDKGTFYFQELGVDFIILDESHYFKNLSFVTKAKNIRGIGNPTGSKKTAVLLAAIRGIQSKRGSDSGVIFASGTPISNSLSELYLLFKYLRPQYLADIGVKSFDSWTKLFATATSDFENYLGKLKQITRFRSFQNVPELLTAYREIADVRNELNLELPRPAGNHHLVKCAISPLQRWAVDRINAFIKNKGVGDVGLPFIRYTEGEKNPAFSLVAIDYAKKISLDPRLVSQDWGAAPGGKIEKCVNNVAEIYHKWTNQKGAQLIFCDSGTPKSTNKVESLHDYMMNSGMDKDLVSSIFGELYYIDPSKVKLKDVISRLKSNEELELDDQQIETMLSESEQFDPFVLYDSIKNDLIEKGIPENEIAYIHSYSTSTQRSELYDKVRNGDIRVLLGSTVKMGVGVSVQDRLIAAHHLDMQWRFSDVEQRNGRIIRQGNWLARDFNNNEVDIYYYATEETLDTWLYEMNDVKGKLAATIKATKINARTIEDFDSGVDLGEMAAELANDVDMKRREQINKEVKNLMFEQEENRDKKVRLEKQVKSLQDDIRRYQNLIKTVKPDIDYYATVTADKTIKPYAILQPDGSYKTLEKTSEIGYESFNAYENAVIDQSRTTKGAAYKKYPYAQYYKYNMFIEMMESGQGGLFSKQYFVLIEDADENVLYRKQIDDEYKNSAKAFGLFTSISNTLASKFSPETLAENEKILAAKQTALQNTEKAIAEWTPVDNGSKIDQLIEEQVRLNAVIEEKQKNTPPVLLDKPYPHIDRAWVDLQKAAENLPNPDEDPDDDGPGGGMPILEAQIFDALPSSNQEIAASRAKTVAKAIRRVAPKAKFVFHVKHDDFVKTAKTQTKQNIQNWVAFHNPSTNEFHVSMEQMTDTSVYHEGLHPVIAMLMSNDTEAVNELYNQLHQYEAAQHIIEWAEKNYGHLSDTGKKVEALIEFLAEVAADKHPYLVNYSFFDRIVNFFQKLLSKIGISFKEIDLGSEKDLVKFAKKVHQAFHTGTPIARRYGPNITQAYDLEAQNADDRVKHALDQIAMVIISQYEAGVAPETISNSLIANERVRSFLEARNINPMMYVAETLLQVKNPQTGRIDNTILNHKKQRLENFVSEEERTTKRNARREREYNQGAAKEAMEAIYSTYDADSWKNIEKIVQEDFSRIADRAEQTGNYSEINKWIDVFNNTTNQDYVETPGLATYDSMMINKFIFFFRTKLNANNPETLSRFIALEKAYEQKLRTNAQFVAASHQDATPENIINHLFRLNEEREERMKEKAESGREKGKIIDEIETLAPSETEIDEAIDKVLNSKEVKKRITSKSKSTSRPVSDKKKQEIEKKLADARAEFRRAMGQASLNLPVNAVPALVKLIKAYVDSGLFTIKEIREKLYEENFKDTKFTRTQVFEDVNELWDQEGRAYAGAIQTADAAAELIKAIKNPKEKVKSKVASNLVEIILRSNPEYMAAKNESEEVSAKEKLSLLLQDKQELRKTIEKAQHTAIRQIEGMRITDVQKAELKIELSQYVDLLLNQQGGLARNILREAFRQGEMQEAIEIIKTMVRKHYMNTSGASVSLAAQLVEELGIDAAFAETIQNEMEAVMTEILETRRGAQITALVQELDPDKSKHQKMKQALIKVLASGAAQSDELKNALGKFLGYRGVSVKDINSLIELQGRIALLPENEVRAELIRQLNDIVMKYEQNAWAFMGKAIVQLAHVNALSNILKTAFLNAGIGALASHSWYMMYHMVTNPGDYARARKMRKMMRKMGYSLTGQTYKEFWSNSYIGYGLREITDMAHLDKSSSSLDVAASYNMKELMNEIKATSNKTARQRLIAVAITKVMGEILGSGRYNPVSKVSTYIMGLSDMYMSSKAADTRYFMEIQALAHKAQIANDQEVKLAMEYLAASPERKAEIQASPLAENVNKILELMAMDENTMAEVDAAVQEEVDIMLRQGEMIPKGFAERRRITLLKDRRVPNILRQVEFEVAESLAMNKPVNLGAVIYKLQKGLLKMPNDVGPFEAMGRVLSGLVFMFSKTASNTALLKLRGTPVGMLFSMMNKEYKENADGKLTWTRKDETVKSGDETLWKGDRKVFQLMSGFAAMAFFTALAMYLFDYEEEGEDEEGNPIMKIKFNQNNDMISFHGKGPERYDQARGMQAGFMPNSIELRFVDDPSKRFISMNRLPPALVPAVKLLAEASDEIRYGNDEEYEAGSVMLNGVRTGYKRAKDPLSPMAIGLNTFVYAMDNEFSGYTKVLSDAFEQRGGRADYAAKLDVMATKLFVDPLKTSVSPKLYEALEKEIYSMTNQPQWRSDKFVKKVLKNLWFTDPFLSINPAEEDFVLDHFGQPILVQSDAKYYVGAFIADAQTGMAEHIQNSKYYALFRDINQQNDSDKFLLNRNYAPSELKVLDKTTNRVVIAKLTPEQKRELTRQTQIEYGQIIENNYEKISSLQNEQRLVTLNKLFDYAKDRAKVKLGYIPSER